MITPDRSAKHSRLCGCQVDGQVKAVDTMAPALAADTICWRSNSKSSRGVVGEYERLNLEVARPSKRGFSLLELLIVLAIMAGATALVWPSLSRPLAETSVQQAGNLLRDQIASCRHTAALSGQPMMMRFEIGRNEVTYGSWQALMAEELDELSRVGSDAMTRFQFIDDIVVEAVLFADELPVRERDNPVQVHDNDASTEPYTPADEWEVSDELPSALAEIEIGVVEQRYLPLLPDGQSRETTIVLRDEINGSRVKVQLDETTGRVRTFRVAPEQEERDGS